MSNERIQREAAEQEALFAWAELMRGRLPGIERMYHCPNGGSRNPVEAANLKRQGVKPGVPDIFLPVARGRYHGLYIEMKTDKGRLSDDQRDWLSALREQGYAAYVCRGWERAAKLILKYYELEAESK